MKRLLALSLVALVYAVAEARLVSKCELKQKLENATLSTLDVNFVAKLVCHVQNTTGFNTSAFSQITEDSDRLHGGRHKRSPQRGRKGWMPILISHPDHSVESSKELRATWNLYGLFMHSNEYSCTSDSVLSGTQPGPLNLCGTSCNAFLDEDITNDISCLKTIKSLKEAGHLGHHSTDFLGMVKLHSECASVVASQYFADC